MDSVSLSFHLKTFNLACITRCAVIIIWILLAKSVFEIFVNLLLYHFPSITPLLTYLCLLPLVERTTPITTLQPTLTWTLLSSYFPVLFTTQIPAPNSQANVFFDLPNLLSPSGFLVEACLVMQFDHSVCPVHLKLLSRISSSTGIWFVPY